MLKKAFTDARISRKEFLDGDEFKKRKILENVCWNLSFKNRNIVTTQLKSPFNVMLKVPKNGSNSELLTNLSQNLSPTSPARLES